MNKPPPVTWIVSSGHASWQIQWERAPPVCVGGQRKREANHGSDSNKYFIVSSKMRYLKDELFRLERYSWPRKFTTTRTVATMFNVTRTSNRSSPPRTSKKFLTTRQQTPSTFFLQRKHSPSKEMTNISISMDGYNQSKPRHYSAVKQRFLSTSKRDSRYE